MIYILIISTITAYITNKQIYKVCKTLEKNKINTLLIYTITILIMLMINYKYNITSESIRYLLLVPWIITISIIDYYTTYIYDKTVISGIIIQAILLLVTINQNSNITSYLVALVIGFVVPYILVITTKSLGEGDIGVYCLCCFTLGQEYAIYLILLSFLLACPYCIYIILFKNDKKIKIPFSPYISLGTLIIILTKFEILNYYIDIIK